MASLFKPCVIRYVDADGHRVPKGTPGAYRIKDKASHWFGQYKDASGELQRVSLATDKAAARQMLNDLVRKAELQRAGIIDPFEVHRKRPLADHLADFEASLRAKNRPHKQIVQVVARVRRIIQGCGFTFLSDLSASRVELFISLHEGIALLLLTRNPTLSH
jgi:hypothetical protein